MLSYLYVLKVCAVCGLAPLAFQSVTAVGLLLNLCQLECEDVARYRQVISTMK